MATDNQYTTTTIKITEDLSASTAQYHAIAFNDQKLANDAEEASGILIDRPENNQHATIALAGEIKFAAGGGTITAGDKLTVTTSGWFTTAGSDDAVVGEAKYTVTSGSIGTGIFEFATSTAQPNCFVYDVTPAVNIVAGNAYDITDHKQADDGDGHTGCAPSAISSGVAGQIVVGGITKVLIGGGTVTKGTKLTVATSGYYIAADSGYWIVGQALASSTASGYTGDAFIYSGNVKETL